VKSMFYSLILKWTYFHGRKFCTSKTKAIL